MQRYHARRKDREIKGESEMLDFLESQKLATIALCKGNKPYLFTADYGFDRESMSIFIHCAEKGKKIDYLEENPAIWGQVIEDMGYLQGECDHRYRSVQFSGTASLVRDLDEKRKALCVMIDQLEEDPEKGKREFIEGDKFERVLIIKIRIEGLSGKESLTGSGE